MSLPVELRKMIVDWSFDMFFNECVNNSMLVGSFLSPEDPISAVEMGWVVMSFIWYIPDFDKLYI